MREYANLVRQVIETGQSQDNERTGVGTLDELDGDPISFYVLFIIRNTETNVIVDNVLW